MSATRESNDMKTFYMSKLFGKIIEHEHEIKCSKHVKLIFRENMKIKRRKVFSIQYY